MDDEMVSLRWNNHLTILQQLLHSLREEESLIDVTLACEGKLFSAHKFVLSMCSDYFKEMFMSNPCKHPIVFMKDVRGEDMNALLDFVYHGVVHIPQDNLSSLLKTAEGLQIRGLGVFSREAAAAAIAQQPPQEQPQPPLMMERPQPPSSMDSNILMSPTDRKRSYEVDHEGTPLIGFTGEGSDFGMSDSEFDISLVHHSNHTNNIHITPTSGPPPKKTMKMEVHDPPAPIPDLPKIGEDMLDMGGGVSISASDYYRFRRTNGNRYVNDLLRYFFPIEILASSSLTGGECFANKERGPSNKHQLDPVLIRVITHDAIRNFPNVSEKQVRTAIRRKLNTESRIYRGLINPGSVTRRKSAVPGKPRFSVSPRAHVSIEKSDRDKSKIPMVIATPNVTVEKASAKDVRRQSYVSPQANFMEDKKREDQNYFRPKATTPNQHQHEQQSTPPIHQSSSNSATPTPIATPTLPTSDASSPQAPPIEKSFNLIKSESQPITQYVQQDYTYTSVVPPHPAQGYLTHPMSAGNDATYLRRLEMQGSHQPLPLTSYYHTPLPTADSMEQNLHM